MHILSPEEMQAYRSSQDRVMHELYDMNSDIDKKFFDAENPIFNELTPEEKKTVLQDKKKRHNLLLQRMKATMSTTAEMMAATQLLALAPLSPVFRRWRRSSWQTTSKVRADSNASYQNSDFQFQKTKSSPMLELSLGV